MKPGLVPKGPLSLKASEWERTVTLCTRGLEMVQVGEEEA